LSNSHRYTLYGQAVSEPLAGNRFAAAGVTPIIVSNRGRCPLTGMAARHTEQRSANFDIYRAVWLARYNKAIFGTLFVVGGLFVLTRWWTSSVR
jgi:hypothetical protein